MHWYLSQGPVFVLLCRLSTIRNANKICVISRGEMIEEGTHSDLISRPNSAYSVLVKLQVRD